MRTPILEYLIGLHAEGYSRCSLLSSRSPLEGQEKEIMAYDVAPSQLYHAAQRVCLAFPEAVEKETWGHPTFRVTDKIFVTFGQNDEDEGASMTMKAPSGEQDLLLATDGPFFYPKYVGSSGWIGIRVTADTDWEEVQELVDDSYRTTAPKRLIALIR